MYLAKTYFKTYLKTDSLIPILIGSRRGLNPRSLDLESPALPSELPCFGNTHCYNSMKYWRNWWHACTASNRPLMSTNFCINLVLLVCFGKCTVVYFDQHLGTAPSKRWLKYVTGSFRFATVKFHAHFNYVFNVLPNHAWWWRTALGIAQRVQGMHIFYWRASQSCAQSWPNLPWGQFIILRLIQ